MNKLYMHNPESIIENDPYKLLILARRLDLKTVDKKENLSNCGLCCLNKVELKESEKKDKYFEFASELKKNWSMKEMDIPIVIGVLGTVTKGLKQRLGDLEIKGRLENNSNNSFVKIGQNTKKSPSNVVFWPFDSAQNAIQGDAPEGSDTFQWQLWEEIAWAEIGSWNGTR